MLRKVLYLIVLCALVLSMNSCKRGSNKTSGSSPGLSQEWLHTKGFSRVSAFSEGLAGVYIEGEGGGYIDYTGEFVIPNRLYDVGPFIDGIAIVALMVGDEDYPFRYGLLNKNGELIVPIEYIWIGEAKEGLFPAQREVIQGDKVEQEVDAEQGVNVEQEVEIDAGLISVYGFLGSSGEIVIPFEYDYADTFSEGLAVVSKDNMYGYIDKTGKTVIPFGYELAFGFSEGLAAVSEYGKYGFINQSGKIVIPIELDYASKFSEGLAFVAKSEGGGSANWGYIDKSGNTAIPCVYLSANDFKGGISLVGMGDGSGNAYIDKTGKVIAKHADYLSVLSFSEGLAAVREVDGKWGFIDSTGRIAIACEYEAVGEQGFSSGLAAVKLDNKWGFIDTAGDIAIPCEYDILFEFVDGFAVAAKDSKCGVIDKSGNVIVPFVHEIIGHIGEGFAFAQDNGLWRLLSLN